MAVLSRHGASLRQIHDLLEPSSVHPPIDRFRERLGTREHIPGMGEVRAERDLFFIIEDMVARIVTFRRGPDVVLRYLINDIASRQGKMIFHEDMACSYEYGTDQRKGFFKLCRFETIEIN